MKRLIALLLCAGMVCSFTACDKKEDVPADVPVQDSSVMEEEPVADDTPQQEPVQDVNEYGMPLDADNMLDVVQALIVADLSMDSEYAIWNTDFIYTACGMLLGSESAEVWGGEVKEDMLYVPSEAVKQCVNAMFAGYDANTDPLPEIPDDVGVVYDEASDSYGFPLGEYGDQAIKVSGWEESGSNGLTVKAALVSASDGVQFSGTYDVFMNSTTYEGSEPIYNYMITSFVMVEGISDDLLIGEEDITEEEALAIVEGIYGADGAKDADTGNIVGYNYEGVTGLESENYHNFRMTWLVMDENGEPSHSSYLQNVFVSVDGSDILEGYYSSNGWEILED